MTTNQNLLVQMKLQNIIKDDDNMEYITPDKQYKFIINRYDSSTISSNGGNRYIIETNVYDICGTNIATFRMNEIDCLRFLDCMDNFINDIDGVMFNNYMHMAFSPEQGTFYTHIIEITNLNIMDQVEYDTLPEYYKDYASNDYRDKQIELKRFTPLIQQPVSLFKFICSEQEYRDFMFAYFFIGLIDIELDTQMENIANTIIDGSFAKTLNLYPYTIRPDRTYVD